MNRDALARAAWQADATRDRLRRAVDLAVFLRRCPPRPTIDRTDVRVRDSSGRTIIEIRTDENDQPIAMLVAIP